MGLLKAQTVPGQGGGWPQPITVGLACDKAGRSMAGGNSFIVTEARC